ncbi:restriction endonuclease subunit S [Campylobacter upsaliensis]
MLKNSCHTEASLPCHTEPSPCHSEGAIATEESKNIESKNAIIDSSLATQGSNDKGKDVSPTPQHDNKAGLEGNALSPRLRELEKEFKQNGGLWREFKITQLFDYERGTRLTKGHRIAGNIPLLTAGEFNQGVKEFISNEEQKIFSNAITIDMFCNSFVHIKPFCCDDNILVLTAKKQMNQYHLRFISTIIGKDKPKYGYGKQYRIGSLEKHYISLPVLPTACHTDLEHSEREVSQNIESKKDFSPTAQNDKNTKSNAEAVEMRKQGKAAVSLVNCGFQGGGEGSYLKGNDRADNADAVAKQQIHTCKSAIYRSNATQGHQIAFNYMESYIKELEAYLKVTGLNDYTLTHKEKEALRAFENLGTKRKRVSGTPNEVPLKWESFKIGELFEIKPTKAYKMTNTTLFETKGDVPVVTNSSLNNGVSAYVGLEPTEKGNMITYSDTTTSEGIFYQPRDFVGYSHIQGLYPLVHKDKWNRYSLLYFVSVFRKASFGKFDYGNKFNRKIAKEMRVLLPVLPTACHTEPLGEVSQVESKRDFSLATQTQNDKNVESSATQDYQIAFDFIESFIKAIQKECIKSVVLWQKREAEAYRACVKED